MIETKFKHTDIGLVPEDWEVSSFGAEFKKLNAASYTWNETSKDGACAYLHYGEIHTKYHDHLDVWHSDLPFISAAQAKRFNKLHDGDLVMLNASEDYDGVNDCVEITNCDTELIAGQHTIPLRPLSDKLVKGFIGYIPSIPAVRMQLIENAVGTKVYGVTNEMLQTVLFPIPTRQEQQRIASALMKVDALISNLDKLIAKKQAIKQGAMQELLTGKKRLPGFEGEWKEAKLGDYIVLRNGYAFKSDTYVSTGIYKVITIGNVQSGKLDLSECPQIKEMPNDIQKWQLLAENDILISMTGNVGRVCIVDKPNCLQNQRVGKFDFLNDQIDRDFFYTTINNSYFANVMIEKGQGGAQPNIGKTDIEGYKFVLPADIAEQRSIAHVLSTMDADIFALEKKRKKYRHIKQGMMRDLLTGRIRLVENDHMERKCYSIGLQNQSFDGAVAAEPSPQ